MEEKILLYNIVELEEIARDLQRKIGDGLETDGTEIACLPTYITPNPGHGKVLALDWGGTNFRAAIVELSKDGQPKIIEVQKARLSAKETQGFKQEDLFREMTEAVNRLCTLDKSVTQIGYCFSYPASSTTTGDATLLRWTKGIDIPDMIGKNVGEELMAYLNKQDCIKEKTTFKSIKVLNDTVACLFAGLSHTGYDTHIGLIVGTGTNMAPFMRASKIDKLDAAFRTDQLIPVNLESGNFHPPHLTVFDDELDASSNNAGQQRFEKAVSGFYLDKILRQIFTHEEFDPQFDSERMVGMINYPDLFKSRYVRVARRIYLRSAQLVAASLAGVVLAMLLQDNSIKKISVAAEGALFWSKFTAKGEKDYQQWVSDELGRILERFGFFGIKATINHVDDANLVGSAIAALS